MTPYFSTPERISALQAEAATWIGTPFRVRSAAKGEGGGIDCVRLAREIMVNIGAAMWKELPAYEMDNALHAEISPIESFLSVEHPEFHRLPITEPLMPGDMLAYKTGRALFHIAVVVDDQNMIQALRPTGAQYRSLQDPVFLKHFTAIYRRMEEAS